MKNTKMLEIEVPADGKRGVAGGAYCHYFMYTKKHGNFVLKGFWREIENYIKEQNYGPWFANRHVFRNLIFGQSSSNMWIFYKDDVGIFEPDIKIYNTNKYIIRNYSEPNKKPGIIIKLKRMPHKWIPEFDKL